MAKNDFVAKFVAAAKASKNDNGEHHIDAKDLSKLIKFKLGQKFPGVKFSVKSRFSAIDVRYETGPPSTIVDEFLSQFTFGGFDGMIDLAYSSSNWLLEDGSMVSAASSGTQGSMGIYPAFSTDCPAPGAVLVTSYVKYIHAQNGMTKDFWTLLCNAVAFKVGHKLKSNDMDEYVATEGEYLSSLAWKFYGETFRAGGEVAYADPNYVAGECHKILAASVLEQVADELEEKAIDELVAEFALSTSPEDWL